MRRACALFTQVAMQMPLKVPTVGVLWTAVEAFVATRRWSENSKGWVESELLQWVLEELEKCPNVAAEPGQT